MTDTAISAVVRDIVGMLVDRDYDGLEKLTGSKRLTADEIAQAVREYGSELVMPPPASFDNLDIIEVENVRPTTWSVRMDLWAAGEGLSDLTLELTLREVSNEGYDVEIDNIHVL